LNALPLVVNPDRIIAIGLGGEHLHKHSRVKQYLKGSGAMWIETVINCPVMLPATSGFPTSPELLDKAGAGHAHENLTLTSRS